MPTPSMALLAGRVSRCADSQVRVLLAGSVKVVLVGGALGGGGGVRVERERDGGERGLY